MNSAWNAWQSVTPVLVGTAETSRLVRVRIPDSIPPNDGGNYDDVRLLDERGRETPYAIDPQSRALPPHDAAIIDRGFLPHQGTQIVLDLTSNARLVDTVALSIDESRQPTYFKTIAIDASDDRRHWRVVREDAIVYRVAQDDGHGNQTIHFPATRSRWLRFRVLDGRSAFPILAATIGREGESQPSLIPLAVAPLPRSAAAGQQIYEFIGRQPIRPSAVMFSQSKTTYERNVRVESRSGDSDWTPVGGATIASFGDGTQVRSFAFTETTARNFRIIIENGNDDPVVGLKPVLLERPHEIVFLSSAAGTYSLLSGNATAVAPTYDLGNRLGHTLITTTSLTARATQPNPAYHDERPVVARNPWIVTAALIAVSLILGGLALKTLIATRDETVDTSQPNED